MNKIVVLEGLDCSGKTEMARILAKDLGGYFIDTELCNTLSSRFVKTPEYFDGINLATLQFFNSVDSLMFKTRYAISEMAYQNYFERKGNFTMDDLELPIADRLIYIFIDVTYKKYIELSEAYRPNETLVSSDVFEAQKKCIYYAIQQSNVPVYVVENIGSFSDCFKQIRDILVFKENIC